MSYHVRLHLALLIPSVTGQGAGAGAGARRTHGAAQGMGRSAGRGGHREQGSENLESGVRALREYACDATAKRQTVHVSVNCK
eukprot:6207561-Pleurochrysis_carterae.AAC.2